MKINLQSGSSGYRHITIVSDMFTSTAHFHRNERTGAPIFSCEVKIIPEAVSSLETYSKWPIPRLLILFAFLWVGMSRIMRAVLLCVLYGLIFSFPASWLVADPHDVFNIIFFVGVIGYLCFLRIRIASWHAAEHMAFNCYETHQKSDAADIAKESRIHKKCGGRLALPMILCMVIVSCSSRSLNDSLNSQLLTIFILETILWIDHLVGFDTIPVFSHASVLLQKYLTTKPPGEEELETASMALRDLLAAHREFA